MVMVLLLLIRYSRLPRSRSLRSVCAEPGIGLSRFQRTPNDTRQVSTIVYDSPYRLTGGCQILPLEILEYFHGNDT